MRLFRVSSLYIPYTAGVRGAWSILTDEVLAAGGEALRRSDVVEERLDILVELLDLRRGDEAVHSHVAVPANEKLPVLAADADHADRVTDGVDTTQSGEPVSYLR